ncbi:MAG: TetR/AcrR family transcriptional regulator [Myxococcaceae bacterium]|nr:MAG: TetR/AcrR family transcriptional regulator [Myxococcaceae bacterium]
MTSSAGSRVRMSPDDRREQLLDIGVELLATRPLEELSIELLAEKAGISRGLLYHYFANKQEFHVAVVRRSADGLIAITAPRDIEDPIEQLRVSTAAYVDYVSENYAGYVSLIRAAQGGNDELREIYEMARDALTSRVFEAVSYETLAELGVVDSPLNRLLVRGWAAATEEIVVSWVRDPAGVSREELLTSLASALPAMMHTTSD